MCVGTSRICRFKPCLTKRQCCTALVRGLTMNSLTSIVVTRVGTRPCTTLQMKAWYAHVAAAELLMAWGGLVLQVVCLAVSG